MTEVTGYVKLNLKLNLKLNIVNESFSQVKFGLPYSLKLTFQVINAKMDFFALILGPLIKGGVNFGDLNYMEC